MPEETKSKLLTLFDLDIVKMQAASVGDDAAPDVGDDGGIIDDGIILN